MSKLDRPQFQLSRVFSDGTREDLEIAPVTSLGLGVGMDRRGLLGVGVAVSSVLAGLAACGPKRATIQVPSAPATGSSGPLKAHKTSVSGLSLAPEGSTLVTAGQDDEIKVWGFPSGEYRSPFRMEGTSKNGFQALLLSPDGQKLVTETHDLLSEIDVKSFPGGETLATLTGHTEPVQSLSVSPDSRTLASGSADKTVRLWSLDDGRHLATFQGHTDGVTGVQISPDGEMLYSGSLDGSVRVWSVRQRRFLRRLEPGVSPISDVALSRDGQLLASGSRDGSVSLWSVPDGSLVNTAQRHSGNVRSVQFSRDGDTVISGSEDGTVRRWSVKDRSIFDEIHDQGIGAITRILPGPDGVLLLIGTALGILMLWDLLLRRACTFFFDPSIVDSTVRGATYSAYDSSLGRIVSYTLPCGSPIPAGATCTCNCVPGLLTPEPPPERICTCNPQRICTCNPQQICTCNPQCYCNPQQICTCNPQCSCNPQQICTCDKVCTCIPVG
jgi:WD40 repeat protein